MTIEELRKLFIIGKDASDDEIKKRFEEIAEALFNNFAIETDGVYYTFKEIEFYFYNSNHKDIITHPRDSKPMQFYVNDFGGIDINFESSIKMGDKKTKGDKSFPIITRKYVLNDEAYFGGVLIRQLKKLGDEPELLNGPWKCADLFRFLDPQKLPVLVEHQTNTTKIVFETDKRKNLRGKSKDKVGDILKLYDNVEPTSESELRQSFEDFISSPYRYVN